MELLSVNIRIPALENSYEFLIPSGMSVQNAQYLIVNILRSEYGISGNYDTLTLFSLSDGLALRLECSFEQLGITNGQKLIFM